MLLKILLLILMSGSYAFAQSESLQIDGPHEVQAGVLVRLTANAAPNETAFWIVLDPIDLDYEQVDNGKRLLFSSGRKPGPITVMLLAQQVTDNRITTRQIRRTIQVVDDGDLPPAIDPPANDPPPADPPANDPLTNSPLYTNIIAEWPNIRTDAAKERSLAVADNFDAVAQKCQANQYADIPSIWKDLSSQNRETLQIETVAWEPVAFAVQQQLRELGLEDVPSHAFHLRAVAAAIRQAFNQQPTQTLIRRTPQ